MILASENDIFPTINSKKFSKFLSDKSKKLKKEMVSCKKKKIIILYYCTPFVILVWGSYLNFGLWASKCPNPSLSWSWGIRLPTRCSYSDLLFYEEQLKYKTITVKLSVLANVYISKKLLIYKNTF